MTWWKLYAKLFLFIKIWHFLFHELAPQFLLSCFQNNHIWPRITISSLPWLRDPPFRNPVCLKIWAYLISQQNRLVFLRGCYIECLLTTVDVKTSKKSANRKVYRDKSIFCFRRWIIFVYFDCVIYYIVLRLLMKNEPITRNFWTIVSQNTIVDSNFLLVVILNCGGKFKSLEYYA